MYKDPSESIWYKFMYYGLEFLGRYYSVYQGFVVDNNDPKKLGRIKVIYPSLVRGKDPGTWAFPDGHWGGKNYGMQLLPQIGDAVNLKFSMGDLDYPIWSHHSFAIDEKPEEFSSPNIYGFKTPKGNIILINDDEPGEILVKYKSNNEYIKITTDLLELQSKLIKLGERGDEWTVMGETLKTKLETLLIKLETLQSQLASHTHTTNQGPSGPPIEFQGFFNIQTEFTTLKNSLNEILSKTVKSDK